jgi:hypothetical protein
MKSQLNEVQRLQKIAGLLTENETSQDVTPEEAAEMAPKVVDKLESSPIIDKIAAQIEKDPKAKKELDNLLKQYGINPQSLNEDTDGIAQKLALKFAKKAETLSENLKEESNYFAALLGGLVGGGALAMYIAKAQDVLTPMQKLLGQSPSHMVEAVVGMIIGAVVTVVATKVYDNYKEDNYSR